MAEEQFGARKEGAREWPGWARLFGAFKVALDYKKLLLAAAGILVMAFGWWLWSVLAFSLAGRVPQWDEDKGRYTANNVPETEGWKTFKEERRQWNFLYRMAGAPPQAEDGTPKPLRPDAADVADTLDDYKQITTFRNQIAEKNARYAEAITIEPVDVDTKRVYELVTKDKARYRLKDSGPEAQTAYAELSKRPGLNVESLTFKGDKARALWIDTTKVELVNPDLIDTLSAYTRVGKTLPQIEAEAGRFDAAKATERINFLKALELYKNDQAPPQRARTKPHGEMRTWPWFEDRGPNPFLMATGNVRTITEEGEARKLPWEPGHFVEWMLAVETPVLIEPLIKFLGPVLHLFNPAAGGWLNRTYLVLIILSTLATWAVFGGAITRMAAVQLARKNEKVGLTEALRFAWQRKVSYFTAPLAPLVFLLVLLVLCILAGLIQAFLPWVADVLLVPLLIPGVLVLGLIMAVVLVGLVGWPLMYCTISTEGSDSFDAISRSYSYVFQAAWSYLWYGVVALAYGAALVFFIGLMGSLMVYLGKWGMSQNFGAPLMQRDPGYLFAYTPTSFGWRDLLLRGSPYVESTDKMGRSGLVEKHYEYSRERLAQYPNFRVGAFLTAAWLYLVFLLVIGFGYSYFWTASAMIYLLMRRQVDDTDLEEIHLEEEEEEPFQPTPPVAPPAAKPTGQGNLTMLEPPTLRPAPKPPETAPPPPVAPPPTEPPAAEPSSASPSSPPSSEEPKP